MNLQDRNELAVIDPATDKAVARYPVEGCKGNHGMALDVEHQRAFLACQGNDRLAVFDLDAHKAIVSMPLAAGSDVVQFDAGLGRLYVGCSSGAISVFQEDDPDHFRKLADVSVLRRPSNHPLPWHLRWPLTAANWPHRGRCTSTFPLASLSNV